MEHAKSVRGWGVVVGAWCVVLLPVLLLVLVLVLVLRLLLRLRSLLLLLSLLHHGAFRCPSPRARQRHRATGLVALELAIDHNTVEDNIDAGVVRVEPRDRSLGLDNVVPLVVRSSRRRARRRRSPLRSPDTALAPTPPR